MAAIDKLYITEYSDLNDLRVWATIYYPQLLSYFYSKALTIDEAEFATYKHKVAKERQEESIRCWKQISSDDTINGAIASLMANYGMTEADATDDAHDYYHWAHAKIEEFAEHVGICVMNTPFKVDKKLKWICPLPRIRKYLHDQCGVRDHWYYKLFWKGKDRFLL